MEDGYGFRPEFVPSAPPHQNCACHSNDPGALSYPPVPCHCSQTPPPYYLETPPSISTHYPLDRVPSYLSYPNDDNIGEAYRWVDVSASYGAVPSTALRGGVDVDGHQIYVGRAFHQGDWIPAKVIPGKNVAYVAYDGEEHAVEQFQVLCEQRFDWVPNHGGNLPHGAVQGGRTSDGEPLYIGRAYHEGSQTVGKVHLSHGACYIPFGGKELAYQDYEILVLRS